MCGSEELPQTSLVLEMDMEDEENVLDDYSRFQVKLDKWYPMNDERWQMKDVNLILLKAQLEIKQLE